jgi:predicted acetyltransferase
MPQLVPPTTSVHASFLAAMEEFRAEGRGGAGDDSTVGDELRAHGDTWSDPAVFAAYTAALRADTREDAPRRAGFVPCTTYWYVDGATWIGRLAVRHRLTPFLHEQGGHVGYDVRAALRCRGHATAMLRAALPRVAALGIDPVLITCDEDNTASRKVIETCGGLLEDRRGNKLRFWVPAG